MDKYSELQNQVFQSHIDRDELENSYKVKVGQLEAEVRQCKSLLAETNSLVAQLQESGSAVTDMVVTPTSAQATWDAERNNLQLHIEQVETRAREDLAHLEAQLTSRETEMALIKSELLQKKNAAEQLQNECGLLRGSIVAKDSIVAKYKEEQQQLTQQRDQYAGLHATLSSETVSKDAMQAQAEELAFVRASLTSEQGFKEQFQQEIRERTAERDCLQAEIVHNSDTLAELRVTLVQQREKSSYLECELSRSAKQQEEAQHKIKNLEQECKQLQEEIESANELDLSNIYERQLKKLQAEHANLQTKMQEMDSRAAGERTTALQIAQQLMEEKQGLQERMKDVQRLAEEALQLQENLRAVTEEASKWKEEAAQANQKLRTSIEEAHAHHGSITRDLHAEAQSLRDKLLESEERTRKEHEEANLKLIEMTEQRDLLGVEVTAMQQFVSEMEGLQQLEELKRADTKPAQQLEEATSTRTALHTKLTAVLARLEGRTSKQIADLELARAELLTTRILPFSQL